MKLSSVFAVFIIAAPFAPAASQCRPGRETNEAKLLAFYSAPLTFSIIGPATRNVRPSVRLIGEVEPIPRPDPEIQKTGACFATKSENTSLSPVFGRVRAALSLPFDVVIEGSYLPPVTIADATPSLLGLSIAKSFLIPGMADNMNASIRAHTVRGNVKGPITCPRESLQSSNAFNPCFGSEPSRDTFKPNVTGVEVALSVWSADRANSAFVGAGENWLKPRFQVGFTSGTGSVDNTRVEVDLTRTVLFAGFNRRFSRKLDGTAELYTVPADVTLFRAAFSYLAF